MRRNLVGELYRQQQFARRCALLEPLAIESIKTDAFSYVVGAAETKYVLAGFNSKLGSNGRWEVRNPAVAIPLRGVTLAGIASGGSALVVDPSLPVYLDPESLYSQRLLQIDDTAVKQIDFTGPSQTSIFLPGPYGTIITSAVNFDFDWLIGLYGAIGFNLANEINDGSAAAQRNENRLLLPVSKSVVNALLSGSERSGGVGKGTVTYMICPAGWGRVPDLNSYLFRDDFMGATLDTATVWTRSQSTVGNVEISTAFQWLKLKGDGVWGDNGVHSQASISRAAGKVFLCDVYPGKSGDGIPNVVVGWGDGAGQSFTNFAHGVDFTQSGSNKLNVFENGNARGSVGTGWTFGCNYRVRITLGAANAAYAIQGGTEYQPIGSASWSDITPGTTSSSTTPLYPAAVINSSVNNCYVGDIRAY